MGTIFGDHLSMGTELVGDRLSRGTNQLGTKCGGSNVPGPYAFGTKCVTAEGTDDYYSTVKYLFTYYVDMTYNKKVICIT